MGLLNLAEKKTENPKPKGLLDKTLNNAGSTGNASLDEGIVNFHRLHSDFHCIVLEKPLPAENNDNFFEKVSAMIAKLGSVVLLPSGRALVMLPHALDRELISHRLSRSLNTSAILSFEAGSPENAINRIKSMI